MTSPPKNATARRWTGQLAIPATGQTVSVATKFVNRNPRRELSYREICQIMGRDLRIIAPNEQQFELFTKAAESAKHSGKSQDERTAG
jgi:hypothetical protein